ncbi:MAG: hypothetical protein ABSD13_20450 [Candidatus Korobacteraceae bacterium]
MSSGSVLTAAAAVLLCLGAAACGSGVKGHTYSGPSSMVQISFQSDGKATAIMGPMSSACTYTQSGNNIALICEGDTEQLTLNSDGSLSGPPDGMLGHLTKTK